MMRDTARVAITRISYALLNETKIIDLVHFMHITLLLSIGCRQKIKLQKYFVVKMVLASAV